MLNPSAQQSDSGSNWGSAPAEKAPAKLSPCESSHTVAPVHYQSGYSYPLIVWLHSGGSDERQITDVLPRISHRNYVGLGVRGPRSTNLNGTGFDWKGGRATINNTREMILNAIDRVAGEFNLHPDRIVIGGYRSGATMACRIAMMEPSRFAGVVRIGGKFPMNQHAMSNFDELRERRLPMLWQHSSETSDDDCRSLNKDIRAAQWIRSRVEIRQYAGSEVMNTVALRDIDRWCFDNVINPRPASESIEVTSAEADQWAPVDFSSN